MIDRLTRAGLPLLGLALAGCATVREAVVPAAPGSPAAEARAEAAAPAAPAGSTTGIAPLDYQSRTLANGLRVYSIRDTSTSNVSVQVWYDVGSKDDPRGRSGFAHMFEHLMFKSTRNLVPEQMDRLTEDVGGYNNASTNDDYTNYYEVVPANHLQRLLWAEAERMGSLVVEPGFFASERDVVKEELRSSYLARPYGKLFLYYPQISYDVHPYARPGIGNIEELDAATIDDVRAFHATYYRPDNAVLVVAGNFDPARLDGWIDQYFAPIARPAAAIPRVTAAEPVHQGARHFTVYEANTPLPAAMITYPLPHGLGPGFGGNRGDRRDPFGGPELAPLRIAHLSRAACKRGLQLHRDQAGPGPDGGLRDHERRQERGGRRSRAARRDCPASRRAGDRCRAEGSEERIADLRFDRPRDGRRQGLRAGRGGDRFRRRRRGRPPPGRDRRGDRRRRPAGRARLAPRRAQRRASLSVRRGEAGRRERRFDPSRPDGGDQRPHRPCEHQDRPAGARRRARRPARGRTGAGRVRAPAGDTQAGERPDPDHRRAARSAAC